MACVFINHLNIGEITKQTIDGKLSVKINLLAVHPTMQGHGIARYMMQVVDGIAKHFGYTHVWLTLVSREKHFIDMYTKWGFYFIGTKTVTELGLNPEKYIPSCHFILMEKELLE